MTLQQLTYIKMTAECGNITEAAEKLFISQPSLSAAIHNLEKEMGVTIFVRSKKGVVLTREGEELLFYAGMLLEQVDIMKEHFGVGKARMPKFSVSCQHYSFAVNAFVDVVQTYDAAKYDFILRETQTGEIIDDVAHGKSELGVIYLSEHNEEVLTKLIKKNGLIFEELFTNKAGAEKKNFQIENICRGMLGKNFTYVIFATGISNIAAFVIQSETSCAACDLLDLLGQQTSAAHSVKCPGLNKDNTANRQV